MRSPSATSTAPVSASIARQGRERRSSSLARETDQRVAAEPDQRERAEHGPQREQRRKRAARRELRQEAREEDGHLRVAEVAQQPLDERRRSQPLLRRIRLAGSRECRPQRGQAQVEQVRGARDPERHERGLPGVQQRREPGAGGQRPDELPEGDAGGSVDPAAPPPGERVADRQGGVLPGRDDHERRNGKERRRVREHLGALGEGRRAARAAALLEVLLVVVLGDVERLRGLDHRHDRLAVAP